MTGGAARRSAAAVFFVLAFALTWVAWVPRALVSQGHLDLDLAVTVGGFWAYGPAVAALITALVMRGRAGARELAARLTRWRVGWRWYAIVLLAPPAFSAAILGAFAALGRAGEIAPPPLLRDGFPAALALFAVIVLTDGIGEEVGWRGYALPRLLERTDAVTASLLLGVVWAVWHLPLTWTVGMTLDRTPAWVLLLELPAVSVLFTWVFRHTGGSTLLAILFHASLNLSALSGAAIVADVGLGPGLVVVAAKWLLAAAALATFHRGPGSARFATPTGRRQPSPRRSRRR